MQELSDNEISQLAETRAKLAAARLNCSSRQTHESRLCSVCCSQMRSEKRKASRRARLLQAEQRREAVELEETILLDTLDPPSGSKRGSINAEQMQTLNVILQEHWDEFVHQRMLYSELADELKSISPAMSQTKRKILAQHVLEAVELLEVKADRIERLEKVLQAMHAERPQKVHEQEAKKHPGSRQTSGNRLKHALESMEKSTRSGSSQSAAAGRNSPPTTTQL